MGPAVSTVVDEAKQQQIQDTLKTGLQCFSTNFIAGYKTAFIESVKVFIIELLILLSCYVNFNL